MLSTINEFIFMIKGMIKGWYPKFVFQNRDPEKLPVFVYHKVQFDEFRTHLQYLKMNDYQTVTIMELLDNLDCSEKVSPKHVLLTFDDGWNELYEIAYPLLRSFEFTAVAFITPTWIGKPGMVTWDQVQEMEKNKIIDFQSHSYSHSRINISSRIVDFFNPKCRNYQIQHLLFNDFPKFEFGYPIYESASCLTDRFRYLGDEKFEKQCVSYVSNKGGGRFFKNPIWRLQLRESAKKYRKSCLFTDGYESKNERNSRLQREIVYSKSKIEENLKGKQVKAFSYPYNERSKLADQFLIKAGYRILFGGIEETNINSDGNKLRYFGRIGGDFMLRLPGRKRQSLFTILFRKILRRVVKGRTY